MVVLITGAMGQLCQAIQYVAKKHPEHSFHFADSEEGNITDPQILSSLFERIKPDYVINAAAYTAVDKAEAEPEKAALLNVQGAKNLATICAQHDTTLIHISTDFVFDGTKESPYVETDTTNPKSVYGQTKLDGETAIRDVLKKYFIIRTSWVYSQFGNNFMKTMLRLSGERESISVVNDQIGTPTHAIDLADAILQIVNVISLHPAPETLHLFGTYHFSNGGQCSWYDFAKEIFTVNSIQIDLKPISTSQFPTPASRPKYSVLDKTKIQDTFGIPIIDWKTSLKNHV